MKCGMSTQREVVDLWSEAGGSGRLKGTMGSFVDLGTQSEINSRYL
jgi:hypothetical protein